MVLLSQMMRRTAFTGSTDSMFTRIADQQGAQWAEKTVGRAYGQTQPPQPTTTSSLENLRQQGVLTDSEFEQLKTRLDA